MSTLKKSTELFGEEYDSLEVTTFPVKDGTGYYISHTVDDTRRIYTHYLIRIEYSDGTVETSTADSVQELELWTKHLQ